MSIKNNVSIELTEAELQSVREAVDTLKAILSPHLMALSPADRKRIPITSDGTVPFVEKTMDYAKADAHFLPPYVDLRELDKDWMAVKNLLPVYRDLKQLESNLNDTLMVAGSEAYVGALGYYNSVKYGARLNVADAKVIYEDLRKRFERGSN
jgi:hypothetical protein